MVNDLRLVIFYPHLKVNFFISKNIAEIFIENFDNDAQFRHNISWKFQLKSSVNVKILNKRKAVRYM